MTSGRLRYAKHPTDTTGSTRRRTPREIEVLCLVARGESNKQIAASLVINEKTARNHVERVYAKFGVSNRIGASMYALQHGLVTPVG